MIAFNPAGAPELVCEECGCHWFNRMNNACYECGEEVTPSAMAEYSRAIEAFQARRAAAAPGDQQA